MESLETDDVITLFDVRTKLASFNNNRDDKYKDMMDRINKQTPLRQEIAVNTLAWITYARRPLTVDELLHALVVDLKDGIFKPEKTPLSDDILAFCCGMIILEKNFLQFVHNTAAEFMRGLKETDERFVNFDTTISRVCAAYLCIPELEQPDDTVNNMSYATDLHGSPPEMYDDREIFMIQSGKNTEHLGNRKTPEKLTFSTKLRIYPLVAYAATHLGYHLRAMSDVNFVAANDAMNKTATILEERPKRKFYERLLNEADSYPPQALLQGKFSFFRTEPDSECESNINDDLDPELDGDTSSLPSDGSEHDPLVTQRSVNYTTRFASPDVETTKSEEPAGREVTSLHLAAHLGVPKLVKKLLSDSSLIYVKDFDGCTPLSIALAACHVDAALVILEAGATLDLFSTEGCHLLLIAAQSNSSAGAVVRRILKEALLIRGQGGNFIVECLIWLWRSSVTNALYYSARVARKCQKEWAKVTRRRGEEPSHLERTLQIAQGRTLTEPIPITTKRRTITFVDLPADNGAARPISALVSHSSRARTLMRTYSETVLPPDEFKKRSYLKLVTAAFKNDKSTMKNLIGTKQVTLYKGEKNRGCSLLVNLALFLAVERKEIDGVKLLVDGGVDVDSRDYNFRTPLHRAVQRRKSKLVRFLLEKKADVNAKDFKGDTPWVLAVINKDVGMSELLIRHGADVNTQGPGGDNMLYKAAASGNINEVRFLLNQGVNPSMITDYYWAPLHWAAANGHIECVRLLLEYKAEVSPVSDTFQTPLDLVIEREKVEIEQLLRSKGAKRGSEIQEERGGSRYS